MRSDRQEDNILSLLKEKSDEAQRGAQRGIILQSGAIGDCILTLPLAEFMKDCVGLGGVDILGHSDYIGILPGRSCIDGIRSIDSVDLHRLFTDTKTFDLADGDPLINTFADYAWIVTFLGEPDSDFEQNLIFTANCSRSAEVITLSMKPTEKLSTPSTSLPSTALGTGRTGHITDFYVEQFIAQCGLSLRVRRVRPFDAAQGRQTRHKRVRRSDCLIKVTKSDINSGRELLEETGVDSSEKVVVIQPGSGGAHKRCHIDNFLAVAKELAAGGTRAIFLSGPVESEQFSDEVKKSMASVAKCLTDLSLTEVVGLLSCADGFVGNDSGITHLAAAMGVKTISVFGPTDPAVYGPIGPAVTVLTSPVETFAKEPSEKLQQKILKVLKR